MSYILSIVIPTKNRYAYLKECLKTLVDIGSNDLEIVVQDNTINNQEIVEFIEKLKWEHIRYFHEIKPLTQTENSELAVSSSTGKYVCYIGDDDSISSKLVSLAQLMQKHSVEACTCNVSTYHWEDVVFESRKKKPLSFDCRKLKIKKLDSKKVYENYLSKGLQDIKYLPRAYHAIIAKSVLEKIKNKTGTYFPGPSPDMANATAAALVVKSYYYIRLPLIISGYSYKSAGGMGLRGAHKGKLSGVSQIASDIEETWNSKIPKLWLGYTIWPESSIKAIEAMGESRYITKMNWYAMYAKILLRFKGEYINEIKEVVPNKVEYIRLGYEAIILLMNWCISKSLLFLRRFTKKAYENSIQMSLYEAYHITEEHIKYLYNGEEIEKAFMQSNLLQVKEQIYN